MKSFILAAAIIVAPMAVNAGEEVVVPESPSDMVVPVIAMPVVTSVSSCSNGRCFTPVRSTVGWVQTHQPVRTVVRSVVQPVRSCVRGVVARQPVRSTARRVVRWRPLQRLFGRCR